MRPPERDPSPRVNVINGWPPILYLQGFHCFRICLLRHCSVLSFDCVVFCLLRHHAFSSRDRPISSLSVCYVTAGFWASTFSSSVLLRQCIGLLSLQGFRCFIICLLRHYSVLGFDCLFLCLLHHYLFRLFL